MTGHPYSSFKYVQWHPYRNNSGEDIPPHAVLRIEGTESTGDHIRFIVNKPNSGTLEGLAFNSHIGCAADGFGGLTFDFPAVAAFDDTTGTPESGDFWAPKDDSWLLSRHAYGFRVLGRLNPNQNKIWIHGRTDYPIRGVLKNNYDPNVGIATVTLDDEGVSAATSATAFDLDEVLPGIPITDAAFAGNRVWVTQRNAVWYILELEC